LENAKTKLNRKNLDMIVLNSLKDKGAGFGYDTNKITVIKNNGDTVSFSLKRKKEVALDIVNEISKFLTD
jgi:phosphopantothenoylcysteine decarboxylase/phosphopantothenate--cysteine ligase